MCHGGRGVILLGMISRSCVRTELTAVSPARQVAAILMSKLVLEPETHSGIARAGAIPSLVCNLHRHCIQRPGILHTALPMSWPLRTP